MKKSNSMICIIVMFILATMLSFLPSKASAVNVGIYCGRGVASDKILAMFRAVDSMGYTVKGITSSYIYYHWNPYEFDVIILPAGTGETRTEYELTTCSSGVAMGDATIISRLNSFVSEGGGLVAIEQGARYVVDKLSVLGTGKSYTTVTGRSLLTTTISDSSFYLGPSNNVTSQSFVKTSGGGYLNAGTGQTAIATATISGSSRTIAARITYGSGRVVLCANDPELRKDSIADWTQWDNWTITGTQSNSVYCWQFLGKMITWADTGSTSGATYPTSTEPTAPKVAVVATWIYSSSTNYGGACSYLLPAVAKAIEYSGYTPIAIRFDEITGSYFSTTYFPCAVFPGGYSYGYKYVLGYSKSSGGGQKIYNFINSGGDVMGICAGSFYLSNICKWDGVNYNYLPIYSGDDIGPINHPAYTHESDYVYGGITLASVQIDDPVLYPTGNYFAQYHMIYGGGYKSGGSYTSSVTFNSGYDDYIIGDPSIAGTPDAIRFKVGSGHVYLIGTHPEARMGSAEDWLIWDNWDEYGVQISNPDNPWTFFKRVLDNWLFSSL
jgi:glutamine amidotransferase-like uncharacterized protein